MVSIVVETQGGKDVRTFFNEVKKRLLGGDLYSNPFSDAIVKRLSKGVYYLSFKPVYPQVWRWSIVWFVMANIFGFGLFWVITPALLLLSQVIMFINPTYYLYVILGLRKSGYKDRIKFLRPSEAMRRYF